MEVRGKQTWPDEIGWLGRPDNNLGDDFAYSYLPLGLGQQYYSQQTYPRLRENPAMATAFKQFVGELLKSPPARVTMEPFANFSVGISKTFETTFTNLSATSSSTLHAIGPIWAKEPVRTSTNGTAVNGKNLFASSDAEYGRISTYIFIGTDKDSRLVVRFPYYYRAPVLVAAHPLVTNEERYTVSGITTPGTKVRVGERTVTSSDSGKFAVPVTLKSGENEIRISVEGAPLDAVYSVLYEPKGTAVPLSIDVPGTTRERSLLGTGKTAPFAMIQIGALKGQADSRGDFPFLIPLEEGPNKLEVTATTPAGNQTSWTGVVVVDSKAPELTASVPLQTNLPVYTITGKTEAGATLTLNGSLVTVDKDGAFTKQIALKPGETQHLSFVASDTAGNRTTAEEQIMYVPGVEPFTHESTVTVTGKVQPGTKLTFDGKEVAVAADGSFSQAVATPVGKQVINLFATRDNQPAGFLQFTLINPYRIDQPEKVEGGYKLSGQTVPGYSVMVNAQRVTVDEAGNWSVVLDGVDSAFVQIHGDGRDFRELVTLP